ncbi:MAG: hypothetical protein WD851_02375 [Pirellulales bacterium]
MPDESAEFLERLFNSQETSPALRASYQAELVALRNPKLTPRTAWPGVVLLIILIACTVGLVRSMLFYPSGSLVFAGWAVLAVTFLWVSFLIVRDLWQGRHSTKAALSSIPQLLVGAGGVATVVQLLLGLNAPSDPASTFSAFFAFVFYFACVTLALDKRIAAAELAAREQMLRIECRLADLTGRMTN